ncbi:hypothetical protein JX265_007278 [Neoarthrinium moseri]|uniref:Terpene synthase n=1 Tax=Neoarthrinium moseri TaxID=1658444 RepID=A0A9P9WK02_9PEZI|nr:uncharacterized protein JN550_012091 [Neoarthrinium moseri]KAI1850953.1 hypothetical protein JX266_003618 [Neoarthrinium moseri]KAI1859282.1 hypothetical protein JN550_012091 [Neoarthrinium moseri]KAI1867476.1 hypothetical protein JX265_007278 [Neoarthrinium moseri]
MHIDEIYNSLRGKTLVIPDLRPLYGRWASGVNPDYERLAEVVNEDIDKRIGDEKARQKCKAIDLAFLASAMYPRAEWEQLKTMGLFTVALFVLDDAIDKEIDPKVQDYASDYTAASDLRRDCIAFMRRELKLDSQPYADAETPKEFGTFASVASILLKADPFQTQIPILARDLEEFIEASGPEQQFRLAGTIPTAEDYWSWRHGVGAVFAYATLHQYVANTRLPADLAWSPEVMTMRVEASFQPCLCNDLFSLKKEMREGTVTNMIPILLSDTEKTLESAVTNVVDQLHSSAERFDAAVASLRNKGKAYDHNMQEGLERFIETFETFQTACHNFYIRSKRFGIMDYKQQDGSFLVPL